MSDSPLPAPFVAEHLAWTHLAWGWLMWDFSYVFPPQSVVLGQVAELVRGAPPDTLFIVGAYSIGKEHVYLTVAETLGTHAQML